MLLIPVAEPSLGPEEAELVAQTIASGWISSAGEHIGQFEHDFAKFCQAKYGIATANGTAALHLCLVAAGIGPTDEVIVPSMTFVATANAVVYTGAKPIFVDSEKDTWNIDPEKIKAKITRRTKAIIPVHLYGHPADMDPILRIARKYGLQVIEDAAEAHGALYNGHRVGSLGDMGCFSFYGNKIITTGEGGMIVTSNKELAEKIRILRDHGTSKKRKYYHPYLGFNYRMTNIQAAIGLAQMKKIEHFIERKRAIARLYAKLLESLMPEITLQPEAKWAKSVFWMYSILVPRDGTKNRTVLARELKKAGIDSRPFFFPLHQTPRYKTGEQMPVAEMLGKTGLNLPSSVTLSDEQIAYICQTIITVCKS